MRLAKTSNTIGKYMVFLKKTNSSDAQHASSSSIRTHTHTHQSNELHSHQPSHATACSKESRVIATIPYLISPTNSVRSES
eukprot:gene6512-4689_t